MYDIIVIGAGSGGLNIASFMNKAGFNVLLVDKSDKNIGGDCLNFGCVPSKALIHVSRMIYNAKESHKFGVNLEGKIDLKKVMDYVNEKIEVIRVHENAEYFRIKGMDVVLGDAKFEDESSISVNGKLYTGKKIVLATGSRPRELKIPGVDYIDVLTNENIFKLEELPERLLIIGGGPIGIELGQAFNRLGSKVTVIEHGEKFLPKEIPLMAEVLFQQLIKEGVEFFFNAETEKFTSSNELVITQDGTENKIVFDRVLVSIGRLLNIDDLNIDKAGIELDESRRKLKIDDYLRTTNKNIFVCGDVAGGYQFTHAAELHAALLLNNFFSPRKKKLSYDHLSWVTYTSPEIATFGLCEAELTKRGLKYEKLGLNFQDDDRSICDDFTEGKLEVYIKGGKLLGGSMVAMNAGELFQELVLANSSGLRIKNIFNKIYPYPTASRVNKKIFSNHYSKKLTPLAKKLMKYLY